MKFSERMGFEQVNDVIQINSMTKNLFNDLYNFCLQINSDYEQTHSSAYIDIWIHFFHFQKTATLWYQKDVLEILISNNFNFYDMYNYLEFVLNNFVINDRKHIFDIANSILTSNNSGYRFINYKLVAISNETDIKTIKDASNSGIDGNNINLALVELSKRKDVDYQVVVQKSINAVEMVARHISVNFFDGRDKETLGESIKNLSKHNFIINHSAYLKALGNLYGYTSDGGIRHPRETGYPLDYSDAIFILEICSASVSMLKSKISEH